MVGIAYLSIIAVVGVLFLFLKEKWAGIAFLIIAAVLISSVFLAKDIFIRDLPLEISEKTYSLEKVIDDAYYRDGKTSYFVRLDNKIQTYNKKETEIKESDKNELVEQNVSYIIAEKESILGSIFGDLFSDDTVQTKKHYIIKHIVNK